MPVTLSVLSAILKEIYQGPVREQLNNDVVALRRIERSSSGIESNVGGKYVTFPVHYGRNAGIGARREMEDLPLAGNQATAAARIGLKYQYGTIQLSGQALKLADTNIQAFVSALDLETKGLKSDLAVYLNGEVYRNGTGALATTSSTTATATPVITSGFGNLQVNGVYDVWTAAAITADSGPKITGITISAINSQAGTLTLSAVPGTAFAAGDIFVRQGSGNREWTGLDAIVQNTGVLYNVDPATVDQWRSVVDSNSGTLRALSEGRIIYNVDQVRKNGGHTSVLLTSLGVRRSYFALLVQQRQFVNTSRENFTFSGGFTGLKFTTDDGDIPLVSDAFAPVNTLWGLSEENLKVYREEDWSWMDQDGSMWQRLPGVTAGSIRDAYAATMFQYSELGTDRRGVHFRINDITEA